MKDLSIYYDSLAGNDHIDCRCGRWDKQNYLTIIETWLNKSDLQTIKANIRPGAVGELYRVLGKPLYIDKSWSGANTIYLYPKAGSQLSKMRDPTIIYPKNITASPIEGPGEMIFCKIEGYVSGTSL